MAKAEGERGPDGRALAAALLDAAERIVEAEGLSGLTARALASRAGCSVGMIYHLYGDLDGVVTRLNARTLERLRAALAAGRDDAGAGGEASAKAAAEAAALAVERLATAYVGFTRAQPLLWNALFEHRWRDGATAPKAMMAAIARLFDLVETAMAPLFPPGAEARRRQAALVLWSSLHGMSSLAASGKLAVVADADAEALARDLVRTYLAGLAAAPPGRS